MRWWQQKLVNLHGRLARLDIDPTHHPVCLSEDELLAVWPPAQRAGRLVRGDSPQQLPVQAPQAELAVGGEQGPADPWQGTM